MEFCYFNPLSSHEHKGANQVVVSLIPELESGTQESIPTEPPALLKQPLVAMISNPLNTDEDRNRFLSVLQATFEEYKMTFDPLQCQFLPNCSPWKITPEDNRSTLSGQHVMLVYGGYYTFHLREQRDFWAQFVFLRQKMYPTWIGKGCACLDIRIYHHEQSPHLDLTKWVLDTSQHMTFFDRFWQIKCLVCNDPYHVSFVSQ